MEEVELREAVPQVLSVLVRRGADFATAEDAVQEALIRGLRAWPDEPPSDPKGWLITVAWRAFLDLARSDTARHDREVRFDTEPPTGAVPSADDTLHLYFLCAHPDLTPSSAVALTLRAVGGLTTRQIARAYLVPEPTMAQRISRAKRTVGRAGLDRPGDVPTVMRVLFLVFPAARRVRRPPPRGERRSRACGPALRRRSPHRTEHGRTRPPDAPGGSTQPGVAPPPVRWMTIDEVHALNADLVALLARHGERLDPSTRPPGAGPCA